MDNDELQSIVKKRMIVIYQEYRFLNLSTGNYQKFVNIAYNLTINDKEFNEELFNSNLRLCLDNFIREEMKKEDKAPIIIKNYVKQYMKNTYSYEFKAIAFQKLMSFFQKYNYFPNAKKLTYLLNNNSILKDIFKSIAEREENTLMNNNLNNVINSDLGLYLLKMYLDTYDEEPISYQEDEKNINILGIYFNDISKKLLTPEETNELFEKYRNGDLKARDELIERNLRLVARTAKKYRYKGLPYLDLIQEGSIGLINAVEHFDHKAGKKFSTLAVMCIENEIYRALSTKGTFIKIPVDKYVFRGKYNFALNDLRNKLNREPTILELSKYLNVSIEYMQDFINANETEPISLNLQVYVDSNDQKENADFIPDPENTEEIVTGRNLEEDVRNLIEKANLLERDKIIIKLAYGFDDNEPLTFEEIGKMLGISRQFASYRAKQALLFLSRQKEIKALSEYMDNPTQAFEKVVENRIKQKKKSKTKKGD